MITRQSYMNGDASHREYYSQFVTSHIKDMVMKKVGIDAITSSKDENFNDIPLAIWDKFSLWLEPYLRARFKDVGDNYSLAGVVCVTKEAAKQIKEEYYAIA